MPFEVPQGWVWCTLDDICLISGRIGFRGYTKEDLVEQGKGAITLSPSNIIDGCMNYDKCTYISWSKYEESPEIKVNNYDILLVKTGSSFGKCALVTELPLQATINPQFVVLKRVTIHRSYLTYALQSQYAHKIYDELVLGTAIPTFTQVALGNMEIPIPPFTEQQRIVEEVERWFKLIDIIEQGKADLQTTIKQAKNKILELAIHGKLVPQDPNDKPASELLKRINPKAEITCDNEHYAQLPKGWSIYELMDVAKIVTGSTPSKSNLSYYGGNFPLYKPSDLDAGRHTNTASEYLTTKGRDVSRIIPPNSIAICCIGSIGKVGYIEQEGTTNQQINTAIPSLAIFPDYLYHLCTSPYFQNSLMEKSSAVTISIVNKSKMEHIKIPLPPKEEQARIVVAIDNLFNALDAVKENL